MKVKLSDIANELNISVAAVSMALNNKVGVSEETREEVMKTADRLGYRVKKQTVEEVKRKRFIKLLRIKKHGLVVMETAFFAAVIDGIEEQCRKMGFELLISNIVLNNDLDQIQKEYHDEVEGLISLCTEMDEEDSVKLIGIKCPQVVLDRKFIHNINTVIMNNQKASRQAVEYLYEKGHRSIGYLRSSKSIYNFDSRFKSYLESIERQKLSCIQDQVIELEPTIEGAYRDMKDYLSNAGVKKLPTSFLADNDIIALGAMNALKEYGIKVPDEVSLIGIDDMPFCTVVSPQLTTIKIFKREIGRQAVKMLVEEIQNDSETTRKLEVDTVLIERESVKALI